MSRFDESFKRRAYRVRYSIRKQYSKRLRLSVFRSQRNIYAQVIDDDKSITLCAASTLDASLKQSLTKRSNKEAAEKVGSLIAERAIAAGIKEVIFDRGGYKYHGKVKVLADAARQGGLSF